MISDADDHTTNQPVDAAEAARRTIPLHRAVAVITPSSIAVRQTRAGLVGPLIEAALAVLAVLAIVRYMNTWPLGLLFVLALVVTILAPLALIGFVNNIAGTSFLMERAKRSARWQQGLLGLGIGTFEFVPFDRIQHFAVISDFDDELASGMEQDVVDYEILLVKDNGRELTVARVISARPLADEGGVRANALATALAEMAGADLQLAVLPPLDDDDDHPNADDAAYDAAIESDHGRQG